MQMSQEKPPLSSPLLILSLLLSSPLSACLCCAALISRQLLLLGLFVFFCWHSSIVLFATSSTLFNTYIMYFIKICCRSLSVPLHPITQIFFFFLGGGTSLCSVVMHLPVSCLCVSFPAQNSIIPTVVLWCCCDIGWWVHYLISWLDSIVATGRLFPKLWQCTFSFTSGLCNSFSISNTNCFALKIQ